MTEAAATARKPLSRRFCIVPTMDGVNWGRNALRFKLVRQPACAQVVLGIVPPWNAYERFAR